MAAHFYVGQVANLRPIANRPSDVIFRPRLLADDKTRSSAPREPPERLTQPIENENLKLRF